MINFKQFLNEDEMQVSNDEFIKIVQKECSEYLKNSSFETQLFRGDRQKNAAFYAERPRKNRHPTDTALAVHEILDQWFFEKFGTKYRSGAVFASPDPAHARRFGKLFYLFPTNGYKLCGSKKVNDLYKIVTSYPSTFIKTYEAEKYLNLKELHRYDDLSRLSTMNMTDEEKKEGQELSKKILDKLNYFESKSLTDFGKNEVMISTDKYYLLMVSDFGWDSTDDVLAQIYKK